MLRLARWDGANLTPWINPTDSNFIAQRRAWALSEVAIGRYRAVGRGPCDPRIERAAAEIEAPWREFGENAVILPLLEGEGGFAGVLTREHGDTVEVAYDSVLGLRFQSLMFAIPFLLKDFCCIYFS